MQKSTKKEAELSEQEKLIERQLIQSNLLSGGIESRFEADFSEDTKAIVKRYSMLSGDTINK